MENKKGSELVVGKVYYAVNEQLINHLCRFEMFQENGNPLYSIVKGCQFFLKNENYPEFIGFNLDDYPNIEYTGKL